MKPETIIKKEIRIRLLEDVSGLTPMEQRLVGEAQAAIGRSYAPYSKFHVGSAVLLSNGEIICGSNQENAAYPLGLCAERVALFTAGSRYPEIPVVALALATEKELKEDELPGFPCGSCRQVMIETEDRHHTDMRLFITGKTHRIYVVDTVKDILPFAFQSDSLK